ncbi:uncharacterized protein [Choristoneura fumiferana]|uniref:uncharacterized protein n=1 Tax=Choristoneura fumiferana TaxID=7141 RepID=UPI003D1581C2
MSKRSAEDKIDLYKAKIQKLQQQRFRRVIVYSSSSDSEENSDNGAQNTEEHNDTTSAPPQPDPDAAPESGGDTQNTATPVLEPELAPEMLQALGDPSDDTPAYGPDIHEKLAQRWLPILKKGMPKDAKEQLLKEYSIPGNCKLLRAPTLNAEISAAVAETVRSRDKKIQAKQEQLGLGISAINRAMNTLLTSDDKVQAVKILSDGCRILSDLHFVETQVRTKLITPGLDKAFLSVIQDQDRDETLFGEKLSEKIKASKVIEKQGLQIKKSSVQKPATSNSSSSGLRPRQQGNWSGPPRFPSSSRGGHTSTYRTMTPYPYPYRRQPLAAQPTTTTRSTSATTTSKRAKIRQ